jgi:hypothetical protein
MYQDKTGIPDSVPVTGFGLPDGATSLGIFPEGSLRAYVRAAAVVLAVACSMVVSSGVSAQSVLVQVTASETGAPVAGAFVSLLTEGGEVVRSALTNASGRFLFSLSAAGAFRVKAEMIGRETQVSSPVTIQGAESASIELALGIHAIPLEGIQVEAQEQCRIRPDEAPQIARVWEEARKALTVQAWAENEGLYSLAISIYQRNLDSRGIKVEGERREATTLFTRTPFVSLPAEDLMSGGFIRPATTGGHEYYGPDATVLLSDIFLDTHCFRLRRSGDLPNSIGLGFEPARRGRQADIEGTLWLDQETAELQFLEYAYTGAPFKEGEGLSGGRVEFEAMPNGAWIVNQWWIRAPILAQHLDLVRAGDSGIRVTGILETGGEVMGISAPGGRGISEKPRGSITGTVWDSTRLAPLEGATVYLSGTQYAAVTDSIGHFRLEGLPEGTFGVGFTHPRLDTLGIFPAAKEVTIALGEPAQQDFGIPSYGSIMVESCKAQAGTSEGGGAVLTGTVLDQAGGEPVPGARVRLEWQEVRPANPVAQATDQWTEVSTDGEGRYTVCGIPLGSAIQVRARFMETESPTVQVGFVAEEHRILNLTLPLPVTLVTPEADVASWVQEYGVQGVQGVLRELESGDPVRSAEVELEDASGRIHLTGLSDRHGFFRLQTPLPGRYVFSARALGYAPVQGQVVEVPPEHLTVLEVQMAPDALELEPLVVTAEARAFHLEMEGFYERQDRGAGGAIFITPEKLERRATSKLTDFFFGLAGTRVVEPTYGAGGRAVYFRSGVRPNGICWPMIYVDHQLASTGGLSGGDPLALDTWVHAADVAAVEVYRSPAEVPSEFNGANAGCGVIVVWTRRGGGK